MDFCYSIGNNYRNPLLELDTPFRQLPPVFLVCENLKFGGRSTVVCAFDGAPVGRSCHEGQTLLANHSAGFKLTL